VEGWVEGPCGASADLRGINRLMLDFYDDPVFVRELFDFVLELALRFGRAQVEAGADLIESEIRPRSLVGPMFMTSSSGPASAGWSTGFMRPALWFVSTSAGTPVASWRR